MRTRTGSVSIEYAMMAGLIAVVVVATVQDLGTQVESILKRSVNQFATEANPAPNPSPQSAPDTSPNDRAGSPTSVNLGSIQNELRFPVATSPAAQILDQPSHPTFGPLPGTVGTQPLPPNKNPQSSSSAPKQLEVTQIVVPNRPSPPPPPRPPPPSPPPRTVPHRPAPPQLPPPPSKGPRPTVPPKEPIAPHGL